MVIEINSANFKKEVLDSKIPVIVDFFADWCGPCQMMKPVFETVSRDFDKKLKFTKLDTERNPELAGKFGIQGIPCFIIVEKGKEKGRIVGYHSKNDLKKEIEGILK